MLKLNLKDNISVPGYSQERYKCNINSLAELKFIDVIKKYINHLSKLIIVEKELYIKNFTIVDIDDFNKTLSKEIKFSGIEFVVSTPSIDIRDMMYRKNSLSSSPYLASSPYMYGLESAPLSFARKVSHHMHPYIIAIDLDQGLFFNLDEPKMLSANSIFRQNTPNLNSRVYSGKSMMGQAMLNSISRIKSN